MDVSLFEVEQFYPASYRLVYVSGMAGVASGKVVFLSPPVAIQDVYTGLRSCAESREEKLAAGQVCIPVILASGNGARSVRPAVMRGGARWTCW